MKLKKLYVAMAISTMAAPMAAIADNSITSRLAAGTVTGEAFGGYSNSTIDLDTGGSDETDSSDFDFDRVRLGFGAEVKDNVLFGAELELLPGNEADSTLSNSRFTDLFLQKQTGNKTKTLGRFKQTFNRENAAELSDSLLTESATLDAANTDLQSALGVSSGALDNYLALLNGSSRRIEGGEIKGTNESGLNYTFAVYKGGVDSSDGDSDRNFGYSGSVGWQGGDNDVQFGINAGLFMEDGSESDDTGILNEVTDSEVGGYRLGANLTSGPITANLFIADATLEQDIDGSSADDLDNQTIGVHAAFDLGGSPRKFDDFGVREGPSLSGDDWGYEAVVAYRQDTIEADGSSDELTVTSWGIGLNAYCSEYTKLYASYSMLDLDLDGVSAEPSISQFDLGVRFDF